MNTLTVPKIKDLVNKPTQQYNDIYSTLGVGGRPLGGRPPRPPWGQAPTPPLEGEGGAEYGVDLTYNGGSGGLPPRGYGAEYAQDGGSGGPAPQGTAPQQNINDELSSFLSDLKKNPTSASAKQDFVNNSYLGANEMSYSPY